MLHANIKITEELEQMFFARETIMSKYGFKGFVYNEYKEIINWEVYLECEQRMYARSFVDMTRFSDYEWSDREKEKDQAQKDMLELLGITHRCEKLMMKLNK